MESRKAKKSLLMQLFKDSGVAKIPALCAQLGAFLDDKTSGKVLVFAHHRAVLDGLSMFLSRRGTECIRIDGQTQPRDRFARVKHFQTSSVCRVALLAITAAGVSITLTAASTVYFAELFWTPGSLIQAEDRAHRIGQSATVNVNYLLSPGTIDEILWPMIHKKMRLLGEVVEGHSKSDNNDLLKDGAKATGVENQFSCTFPLRPTPSPVNESSPVHVVESNGNSHGKPRAPSSSRSSSPSPTPPPPPSSPGGPSVKLGKMAQTPDLSLMESLIEELASQDAKTKRTVDDEEHDDDEEVPWNDRQADIDTDGGDQPDKLAMLHMQLENLGGGYPALEENVDRLIPGEVGSGSGKGAPGTSSGRGTSRKAVQEAEEMKRSLDERQELETGLNEQKAKLDKAMRGLEAAGVKAPVT